MDLCPNCSCHTGGERPWWGWGLGPGFVFARMSAALQLRVRNYLRSHFQKLDK